MSVTGVSQPGRRQPPKAVETQLKRTRAIDLRIQGWSYAEIAREMRISQPYAYDLVQKELSARQQALAENVDAMIALDTERLDSAIRALAPKVAAGDARAIEVMLKVQERRAHLHGLDRPVERIDTHNVVFQITPPAGVPQLPGPPAALIDATATDVDDGNVE